MTDDEAPRPELDFDDELEFYETTDFGMISAEVTNDGWIGAGDAMATILLLRSDGMGEQVHLPVQVDNGPVTRGARVRFAVENVTRVTPGETQLSLIDLSGAQATGATEWSVSHLPIRNPFE